MTAATLLKKRVYKVIKPSSEVEGMGGDILNILVISLSIGMVLGLLGIGFTSVFLHGLTVQRARLGEYSLLEVDIES